MHLEKFKCWYFLDPTNIVCCTEFLSVKALSPSSYTDERRNVWGQPNNWINEPGVDPPRSDNVWVFTIQICLEEPVHCHNCLCRIVLGEFVGPSWVLREAFFWQMGPECELPFIPQSASHFSSWLCYEICARRCKQHQQQFTPLTPLIHWPWFKNNIPFSSLWLLWRTDTVSVGWRNQICFLRIT